MQCFLEGLGIDRRAPGEPFNNSVPTICTREAVVRQMVACAPGGPPLPPSPSVTGGAAKQMLLSLCSRGQAQSHFCFPACDPGGHTLTFVNAFQLVLQGVNTIHLINTLTLVLLQGGWVLQHT